MTPTSGMDTAGGPVGRSAARDSATAIHYSIPLVAHDAVFFDAPDPTLVTELVR